MEPNELMIGDWVLINGITDYVRRNNIYSLLCGEYNSLKPIPLNKEILEANNFEQRGKIYVHRVDDNPNHYDFKITEDTNCYTGEKIYLIEIGIYVVFIKNIHKLQHIMRDCNLNDLANNLKLK